MQIIAPAARQSCTAMKETLNKKPIETTNNRVNFLNGLSEDDQKTMAIEYRILVITWARKEVGKHQHLDTVQAKIDIM